MICCPYCQKEFKSSDDFGVVYCSHCSQPVLLDQDGMPSHSKEVVTDDAVVQESLDVSETSDEASLDLEETSPKTLLNSEEASLDSEVLLDSEAQSSDLKYGLYIKEIHSLDIKEMVQNIMEPVLSEEQKKELELQKKELAIDTWHASGLSFQQLRTLLFRFQEASLSVDLEWRQTS